VAVFDRNAPSTKRAVVELLKKDVHEQLLRYASWRTSSDAAAKDLLADAIEGARKGYGRLEVVDSRLAVDPTTADPRGAFIGKPNRDPGGAR
jgi:hypothetical protein